MAYFWSIQSYFVIQIWAARWIYLRNWYKIDLSIRWYHLCHFQTKVKTWLRISLKIHSILIWEVFRFSMAYGKERESFLCEINPIELQNSTCDFDNTDFEDDLSSSSSIPPAESLIASKIAAIPKGDIVSLQILDEKFIFICKKRQESLLKSNFIHLSNDYKCGFVWQAFDRNFIGLC